MKYKVFLVKAFSQDPKSGNPAAVLISADSLNETQMLSVARLYGFSESVFIQKTHVANFKLRYFSTMNQMFDAFWKMAEEVEWVD